MQTPRDILSRLWTPGGGDPAALNDVTLTGQEPILPSSFRVAAAAQVTIAAAGLAAAQIWRARSGEAQNVSVDMLHAAIECRSERYLRVDDKPPPPAWDAIAGIYKTGDGRFVRLHTNFPHHRDNVCKVLGCKPERDDVHRALMQWDAEKFETTSVEIIPTGPMREGSPVVTRRSMSSGCENREPSLANSSCPGCTPVAGTKTALDATWETRVFKLGSLSDLTKIPALAASPARTT